MRSLEVATETPANKHSTSLELNLVKSELIDLKKYNADLEKENEETKNTLEKCEAKVCLRILFTQRVRFHSFVRMNF